MDTGCGPDQVKKFVDEVAELCGRRGWWESHVAKLVRRGPGWEGQALADLTRPADRH
jgi:hypothetical protein